VIHCQNRKAASKIKKKLKKLPLSEWEKVLSQEAIRDSVYHAELETGLFQIGKNPYVGYNAGISLKIDTPLGIFIQPELYYTTFSKEFTVDGTNTTIKVKNNRADLPVLVGYNVLGKTLGIYAGPVASYNLSTDNQYNDFKENATKEFTLGYQFGAQVTISKLVVSARYEGAFSNDQRKFINTNTSSSIDEIRYDNRPSLLMFGVGLNF
jgi:hypothetical protein